MAEQAENIVNQEESVLADEPAQKKVKLSETDLVGTPAADTTDSAKKQQIEQKDDDKPSQPINQQEKIIRQVEYYFGDSNLFRDKFLQEEIAKNDGWVPLATLLTFNRLASLSKDPAVIVASLEESDSGLLEISADKQSVRRHPDHPLPEKNEATRKEVISRTAYVKGFPLETDMSELLEYFDAFPKVANIVMRKYFDKPTKVYKFKGSVFVTFDTKEQCGGFLNSDKNYKESDLIKKWQTDYYSDKKSEKVEKQKEKHAKSEPKIDLPKGAVLSLEGIDSNTTRETIKEAFQALGEEVAFVDFAKGDETGLVRLSSENGAKRISEKLEDSKVKIDNKEVPFKVLEGDDEEKYLQECVEKMKLRRKNHHHGHKRSYRK